MPQALHTPAWQSTLILAWARRGWVAWLLWPLSLFYGLLLSLRRVLYRLGWLSTTQLSVPLVVVGNVVAGGTGKTPVVIALVEHLQQRGIRVGVVSRGYGRRTSGCLEVTLLCSASNVGDEPALIHRRTGAPVFVAELREQAANALLSRHPHTQLIISDDGLQHLSLLRDVEIGVFDDRGVGNGFLLPAGPLREPWPRSFDLVLHTGIEPAFEGFRAQRSLANHALRADGTFVALADLVKSGDQPLLALAAIGQPEVFFSMLRDLGLTLERTVALPDHYEFNDVSRIVDARFRLICTEKDAVKLWVLKPDALAVPLLCVLSDKFLTTFDTHINHLLKNCPPT